MPSHNPNQTQQLPLHIQKEQQQQQQQSNVQKTSLQNVTCGQQCDVLPSNGTKGADSGRAVSMLVTAK